MIDVVFCDLDWVLGTHVVNNNKPMGTERLWDAFFYTLYYDLVF